MLTEAAKQSRLISVVYLWLLQFGLDPRAMARALVALPRFLFDAFKFRRLASGDVHLLPSLHDRFEDAGAIRSEYFWQDLYVARLIFNSNPSKHVDVGSRIDGFVAHVASFREVEVFDIRPLSVSVPNMKFRQVDLMTLPEGLRSSASSLSCLHALEHFGLGRYGDPLAPNGHLDGLRSLGALVAPGGVLYLSCPSGRARVEFNSHRVIDPLHLVEEAKRLGFDLEALGRVIPDAGVVQMHISDDTLRELSRMEYALAVYTFRKGA